MEQQQEGACDNKNGGATFWDLPPELHIKIFSLLSTRDLLMRTALVCKNWHWLTQTPIFWKRLVLSGRRVLDERAVAVVSIASMLKRLELAHWCTGAENILETVSRTCIGLETLHLHDATIRYDDTLEMVARKCTKLKEVSMVRCVVPHDGKHPIDMFALCEDLQRLTLEYNSRPNVDLTVTREYPNLKELTIHDWPVDVEIQGMLSDVGSRLKKLHLSGVSQQQDLRLLSLCKNLEDLSLTDNVPMSLCSITDECLLVLEEVRTLRCLEIRGAKRLTPRALAAFFSRCEVVSRLEYLDLRDTEQFDDNALTQVSMNCPLIKSLILEGTSVTPCNLEEIVSRCVNLRILTLNNFLGLHFTKADLDRLSSMKAGLVVRYFVTRRQQRI